MSVIVFHNGNSKAKPWAAEFYNCQNWPCIVDPWDNCVTLQDKINLAKHQDICSDLSGADRMATVDIFDAKDQFYSVKIITSYQNDIDNLEPVWNQYTMMQWLRCTMMRLCIADQIIHFDFVKLPSQETDCEIVFTPGRCGTHVIMDITGIKNFLHHNNDLITQPNFQTLVNAKKIVGILRRNFIDQAMSDFIAKCHGVVLTTSINLAKTKKNIAQWNKNEFTYQDAIHSFEKIVSFADLLLGLEIVYNKKIEFSLLEDHRAHFLKIAHLKNPYHYPDLISNFDEAVNICSGVFQPIYDKIIEKITTRLGISIYPL